MAKAKKSAQPGFKTLLAGNCEDQATITIRNNLKEISNFLAGKDIIEYALYKEVTDPKTRSTPDALAAQVYGKLRDEVQGNDELYHTFVDCLRANYPKHKVTVDMLDKVYVEKGGKSTSRAAKAEAQPPDSVPASFSKGMSPLQFAMWMKVKNFLPEEDYSIIEDRHISGRVFVDLTETDLKEYGFVSSGFFTMRSILREVTKATPDSVVAVKPAKPSPCDPESDNDDDNSDNSVASDYNRKKKSFYYLAMDRGTYVPQLKFEESPKVIAELKLTQEVKVPYYERGYYTMNSNRHGVCLIINNKTFKDQAERKGADRDEENLVETWRYMGYHVEVRRDMSFRKIVDIFCDIDDFLSGVDKKAKEKAELAHDSFVCCLLSRGNTSCIYSSDSKELPIKYFEKAVWASKRLGRKPKVFFIDASQGEELGTDVVETELYVKSGQYHGSNTCGKRDIYFSYATVQGYLAYRHISKGSWYTNAVCKSLCEESKQNTLDQLQEIIFQQVAGDEDKVYVSETGKKYKQQPTFSNQLNSNVHFFYGETGN